MIILSIVTICKRYLCDLYPPSVVVQIRPGQMDFGNSAEACGFDFTMSSPELGQTFCELHHIRPLASASKSYGTKTKLDDLSILCSNCHRMIHRTKPMGSVEELSQKILKMRQADKYPSTRFPNEALNDTAKAQFMYHQENTYIYLDKNSDGVINKTTKEKMKQRRQDTDDAVL